MSRVAELRAVALLINAPAVPVVRLSGRGLFSVASSRGGKKRYTVDIGQDPPSCVCPWFRFRGEPDGRPCKHIEAARLAIRAREGLGVPLPQA
ncbi:MAG TPA: SWIM zinc finger family protein [Thermoplasmata archaeon]|nr:SWIM zinc finger family protein [Thermoplasmata archaeon]